MREVSARALERLKLRPGTCVSSLPDHSSHVSIFSKPNLAPMFRVLRYRPNGTLSEFCCRVHPDNAISLSSLPHYIVGSLDSLVYANKQNTRQGNSYSYNGCVLFSLKLSDRKEFPYKSTKRFRLQPGDFVRNLSTNAVEEEEEESSDEEDGQDNTTLETNLVEWKRRLGVFIQNSQRKEIVSMDRKDRRDYRHLAVVAKSFSIYSQMYGKVVVFSKVPLPNYRADLDKKRPVRKVSISPAIHSAVNALLEKHLDQRQMFVNELSKSSTLNGQCDEKLFSNVSAQSPERKPLPESILQRKSRNLQDRQRAWQESPEGQKMMAVRTSLPAYKQREALLSAVAKNQVLVVSGETGCGKTTQLPQYILESEIEAGQGASCSIICTQPRRISAMSVSERVAAERGEPLGESVGYKVRMEGSRGRDTHLLFCTTGVLLRRLLVDPSLRGVSHVLVDEIHERGINEDFLLIVLKDVLLHRPDLRLVLMSATLNAELFSKYFSSAPTCHIPGFTHPVRAHFLEDVLELTGHRLTEDNQFDDYGQGKAWKMQKQLQSRKRRNSVNGLVEDALVDVHLPGYRDSTRFSISQWSPEGLGFNLIQTLLYHICRRERPGAVLVFMTGWEDINALKDQLSYHPFLGDRSKVLILPCHGSMASTDQKLIFEHPPPNVRKIVLATNMAETSITINDVVFVVDCGKAKETSYDALNNTPCLLPTWVSKASARQRRGRAGRVQPGEAYHLYPNAVHDAFAEYQIPEMHRTPLHSLCLQIKSLRLGKIEAFLSKAIQPPDPLSVQNAIHLLKTIGALDSDEELTQLGQHLSMFPVEPMIGKMLVMGSIFNCLQPILTIAAGLSLRDPFVVPFDKKALAEQKRFEFGVKDCSDHMAYVRAYDGWWNERRMGTGMEYCWDNFLSPQALEAMHSLRKQFADLVLQSGFINRDDFECNKNGHNYRLSSGVICSGLFPMVASILPKRGINHFKTVEDGEVLVYQNSVLSKMKVIPHPWLVFHEKVKTGIVIIRDSTAISDTMLLLFGGKIETGNQPGHLLMQDGWLEFFMLPEVAETIVQLKDELNGLLCRKMGNPKIDIYKDSGYLIDAVLKLLDGDQNEGSFSFDRPKRTVEIANGGKGNDVKSLLHNLLQQKGQKFPSYEVKGPKKKMFQARVKAGGKYFIGKPGNSKREAERNAAAEALEWLNMNHYSTMPL